MSDRSLRARMLLEEARVLGVDLSDLIAADTADTARLPTVAAFVDTIAATFTPATAATYRPYWRLTAVHLGQHRLAEVTFVDLLAVIDAAVARARHNRPGSTGRSSHETCVAALRALFGRAVNAGLITANPAAALTANPAAPAADAALSMTTNSPNSSTPCAPPAVTPTWICS